MLQCKVLAEEKLTFDKAIKIAKAVETTERDSHGMQDPSSKGPNPAIHAVSTRRPNQMKKVPPQLDTCYCCMSFCIISSFFLWQNNHIWQNT